MNKCERYQCLVIKSPSAGGGGNLLNAVRHSPVDGRLPEATARRFIRDTVKQNGLADRNITLENVLLGGIGVCLVREFWSSDSTQYSGRVEQSCYLAIGVFPAREPCIALGLIFNLVLYYLRSCSQEHHLSTTWTLKIVTFVSWARAVMSTNSIGCFLAISRMCHATCLKRCLPLIQNNIRHLDRWRRTRSW